MTGSTRDLALDLLETIRADDEERKRKGDCSYEAQIVLELVGSGSTLEAACRLVGVENSELVHLLEDQRVPVDPHSKISLLASHVR